MKTLLTLTFVAVCLISGISLAADAIPAIPRVLPPEGLEIPADVRSRLEGRLAVTQKRLAAIQGNEFAPDIEIFTKAVELALVHREFYVEKDFAKADAALDEANRRLDALDKKESPWTTATGTLVQGYRSSIDKSAQPYGMVIPKDHDFSKTCPLYVWLHGRGDRNTDLHFIQERSTRPGQIAPSGAIVVHPFGRHCVGWKHAGEIDVLEVIANVCERYKVDPKRIVLIGFSMGGAGAWHIGAHYTDQFVAVSPGAGFVDTARYQKLTPDRYPEKYVQTLWGLYDVPAYVRNLFNTQVIAYSGELDPQRQASVLMEEAFQSEGRKLEHLIGPGVEHKYEPKTLEELLKRLDAVVQKGQPEVPREVHLQTRTIRYAKQRWVQALGLEQHWTDSRIDAQLVRDGQVEMKTKNISALLFLGPEVAKVTRVNIDGQALTIAPREAETLALTRAVFVKKNGAWQYEPQPNPAEWQRAKARGRQGPIDDAFMSEFVVVTPSGKSKNAAFQAWADFELAHFRSRWTALMRGKLPEVRDTEFVAKAQAGRNVVLFGDADSNSVIKQLANELPVKFAGDKWSLGSQTFDGNRFAPVMIFPAPLSLDGGFYVVLNSGLTFREGHDRTNSQQNPKLPDWAIIDMTQPPDANTPGRIHDAGFFDEQWKLKGQPKTP